MKCSFQFREPDLNTSDWNLIGQFVTGTLQGSALKTDAKPTSRPLTSEAYLPATIDAFFDGISYDKGRIHNSFILSIIVVIF